MLANLFHKHLDYVPRSSMDSALEKLKTIRESLQRLQIEQYLAQKRPKAIRTRRTHKQLDKWEKQLDDRERQLNVWAEQLDDRQDAITRKLTSLEDTVTCEASHNLVREGNLQQMQATLDKKASDLSALEQKLISICGQMSGAVKSMVEGIIRHQEQSKVLQFGENIINLIFILLLLNFAIQQMN